MCCTVHMNIIQNTRSFLLIITVVIITGRILYNLYIIYSTIPYPFEFMWLCTLVKTISSLWPSWNQEFNCVSWHFVFTYTNAAVEYYKFIIYKYKHNIRNLFYLSFYFLHRLIKKFLHNITAIRYSSTVRAHNTSIKKSFMYKKFI